MTRPQRAEAPRLLMPGEVAKRFGVHVRSVTRWANAGRLTCIRTLGVTGPGHRRYLASEVEALIADDVRHGLPPGRP